jgi:hypothetical protein
MLVLILPLTAMEGDTANETLPELVEWMNVSPQPPNPDIMNDEIPHATILGDSMVFLWETDYTHWPNPDGTQPVEYPEDEDIQLRFLTDGELELRTYSRWCSVSTTRPRRPGTTPDP